MRVLRYDIPVDDDEHTIACGRMVHVDCRRADVVTFWATDNPLVRRTFRVFGTGQPIPDDWRHVGTALSPEDAPLPRGALVWHLAEKAL